MIKMIESSMRGIGLCIQGLNGGNLKTRDRFESLSVNGIILKRILNDGKAWTELISLTIGTCGGLL